MLNHSALLVAIGGFFGAIARFSINNWLKRSGSTPFPTGTFVINLAGAFLLGYILGKELNQGWQLLLGTGFMGAFTTFSTFKLEAIQLHANRKRKMFLLYLGASYLFGILLAFLGMKLGQR
ncbi:fluoride efflux transporter CrcB [Anoxybacteroides rupiense]|uniref:fluoride efflux transporter CrcB n=1 Tax=Anoxybacteroides rupiense TaxID=311460 RepID=UPI0016060AB6|nr:fluoride efflux transporter CrcB [Anoxybacillus rupiensis]MBB3905807.1 CrcB protein [Anoxybacillus rupiensis]